MSGCILRLEASHSPVFLLNSCLDLFSAPGLRRGPLSRSCGANLPSSLTVNLSSLSVSSTRPPVSVCGTGLARLELSGFSRELACGRLSDRPGGLSVLSGFAIARVLDYGPYNFAVQRAIPSARAASASPSPHRTARGQRNVYRSSIWFASRLPIRPRLTLIRLALIRNPWPSEEGVSRPLCRYLCLHLLFPGLQRSSRIAFCGEGNAPLPTQPCGCVPRLRRLAYARLLSTRGRSTSELLRTL